MIKKNNYAPNISTGAGNASFIDSLCTQRSPKMHTDYETSEDVVIICPELYK